MNYLLLLISKALLLLSFSIVACLEEKPLVVLVTSYNNEMWIEKNLDSILMQEYSNFRIIYIDDASEDNTKDIVQAYINTNNQRAIDITFIKNKTRYRKLKNIYNAIHTCSDHEIIVQIDGDDYLDTPLALQRINYEYQKNNIWMTYGQYRVIPESIVQAYNVQTCKPTPKQIIEAKSYRKNKWIYTHIRTFYVWLFKQIKLQDIITAKVKGFEGQFFPCCNDMATFWSMLEMAGKKFSYIPDVLYVYNAGNPLAGFKSEYNIMIACSKEIGAIKKYETLKKPLYNYIDQFDTAQSDCIILSNSGPNVLKSFLDFRYASLQSTANCLILYQTQNKQQYDSYQKLTPLYPYRFINVGNGEQKSTEKIITSWLKKSTNNYCTLFMDTTQIEVATNLNSYIKNLEKTKSYAAYCNNKQRQQFCYQHIDKNIFAWKYAINKQSIPKIHSFDGVLFRNDTFLKLLENTQSKTISQLKRNFSRQPISDKNSIGIIIS